MGNESEPQVGFWGRDSAERRNVPVQRLSTDVGMPGDMVAGVMNATLCDGLSSGAVMTQEVMM